MRSLRIALAVLTLGAAVTLSPMAEAKKEKAPEASAGITWTPLEMTTVQGIDDVLKPADDLQNNLKTIYDGLVSARTNFSTVLGVATDAPIATALADLKTKGAGKIKVAMEGTTPKLSASDAVPENVTKGIEAANGLVDAGVSTVKAVTALDDKVKEVVASVTGLPSKLPSMGLDPKVLLSATKIVGKDGKIVADLPNKMKAIVDEVNNLFTSIKDAFTG